MFFSRKKNNEKDKILKRVVYLVKVSEIIYIYALVIRIRVTVSFNFGWLIRYSTVLQIYI